MAVLGIRHVGLRVVSVVLAALLWLVVSGEQTVERVLRVPLEFTNLPPQLELVGEPPAVVDVRVRGSSGTLSRVASGELAAVLDVRTAKAGQRLFHLTSEDVRAPFGVDVVQVSPANVSLVFEESLSKIVPVTVRLEGEPASGFVVSGATVEPNTIEVIGPAGALSRVSEAVTEPVSVAGARSSLTETAAIGVSEPVVRLRQIQNARVDVVIGPAPQEWTMSGVVVEVRGGGANVVTVPKVVSIRVRGVRDPATADTAGVTASVDVTGLGAGRHSLPVRADVPPGVGLLGVDPAEVVVTIR